MLRRVSRAESSRTIQSLAEENEDSEGEGDDLVERDSTRKLQSSNGSTPQNTMTVTVVQPVSQVRPRMHLIRRSSSAVERVALQPPPEEKKDGGDKSLRPRFLQERAATIVHITPAAVDPARVPRSKASAFLLDVLAKAKGAGLEARRVSLEPLRPGVTNTVHYVPSQGVERGMPLRLAGRRNSRRSGCQISIGPSSDLMENEVLEGAKKRRVSASQEHMAAVLRELQTSKQQAQLQLDILHSILRFINASERDGGGKRPALNQMVDIGFISELASILREFRFHTNLQVCVISILSALAEESPVYAYMMSEFDLEKLLQKTAAVHATQDRLVLLASNLVHVIEDSKVSIDMPAYQAEKAAKMRQQSATCADMIVAAIGSAKSRPSLISLPPGRKCSTARRVTHLGVESTEDSRIHPMIASAPSSVMGGSERDLGRLAGGRRQSFTLPVDPPKLSANYRLLFAQKLKKSEIQVSERRNTQPVEIGDYQEKRDRPSSSPPRRSLPLNLTSRSRATAIYSGGSIFVEPSPLSKRLSRQASFSAGGIHRKLTAPRPFQRAQTERLPPTLLSLNRAQTPAILEKPELSEIQALESEAPIAVDNTVKATDDANEKDESTRESAAEEKLEECVMSVEDKEEDTREENAEEVEEESYEDDFDTTGDDDNEDKSMPSRTASRVIASDGDLFDMLHDISVQELGSSSALKSSTPAEVEAATTIQRHIRGTLVRLAYAKPSKSSSSENLTQASERKTQRATSSGKTVMNDSRSEETRSKRTPLSVRAHRQLQNRDSARTGRDNKSQSESIPRAAGRTRPMTAMSTPLITPGKRTSMMSTSAAGVRYHSLATSSQHLNPTKLLQSGGHSAFSLISTGSSHNVEPNSTEIAKEPPDPEALKQIQTLYAEGLQHQKENHLGLAIECYEKALAIPGGQSFASIHVNIGSALMAKNKFSEALESFEQAKHIQPNNIKAIYNYALALLHLDRPKEAQGLLRRILELDPTHEKASTALSHIQDAVRCPPTRS